MNRIIKFAVGAAIAAPLFIAGTALAATNITFVTLNGGPNATIPLGQTAQANVTYNLTGGTDSESMSWQIVDNAGNAALPPTCIDISDRTTAGTYNTSFPIGTGGQTEGTWRIRVKSYGDNSVGVDNQCNPNDLNDTFTTSEILTISSPTDSTTQTGNPFTGNSNGFCALFPASCINGNSGLTNNTGFGLFGSTGLSLSIFCSQNPLLCGISPPTGPPPSSANAAKCALVTPYLNAPPYMYSATGTQLQSALLLDNPHSIPALDNSLHPNGTVPMGFFGIQTHAALSTYMSMYHCN